jgi:hypothetical protein
LAFDRLHFAIALIFAHTPSLFQISRGAAVSEDQYLQRQGTVVRKKQHAGFGRNSPIAILPLPAQAFPQSAWGNQKKSCEVHPKSDSGQSLTSSTLRAVRNNVPTDKEIIQGSFRLFLDMGND